MTESPQTPKELIEAGRQGLSVRDLYPRDEWLLGLGEWSERYLPAILDALEACTVEPTP